MKIHPVGSRPSLTPPASYFTGTVRQDPLVDAPEPSRVKAVTVTFEPGARTAWHTHPLGQTLVVTSGSGLAQVWGGPLEAIRAGDTVWFPPGEKHWHGASPFRKHSTARRWTGSNMSMTPNIRQIPDPKLIGASENIMRRIALSR